MHFPKTQGEEANFGTSYETVNCDLILRKMSNRGRYYCAPCNTWVDDNRASRDLHFSGAKHKANVEISQKKNLAAKQDAIATENSIHQQLHELRRAAEHSVISQGFGLGPALAPVSVPPAPTLQRQSTAQLVSNMTHAQKSDRPQLQRQSTVEMLSDMAEAQSSHTVTTRPMQRQSTAELLSEMTEATKKATVEGLPYEEDGKWYYTGCQVLGRLVSGTECECYVPSGNTWKSAVISIRHNEHEGEHLCFDVTVFGDNREMEVLEKVTIKNIRISAQAPTVDGEIQSSPLVDNTENDTTGLGIWQTISSREIDDDDEKKLQKQFDIEQKIHTSKIGTIDALAAERTKQVAQQKVLQESHDMEARGINPAHHVSAYKGVSMEGASASIVNSELSSVASGTKVAFKNKKRKLGTDVAIKVTQLTQTNVMKTEEPHRAELSMKTDTVQVVAEESQLASDTQEPTPSDVVKPPVVVIKMKTKKRTFRARSDSEE